MENKKLNDTINKFMNSNKSIRTSEDGKEEEVCDMDTGECYVMRSKDGIVERINKKYITEDGRQLLRD
jgi:hypothetical protein